MLGVLARLAALFAWMKSQRVESVISISALCASFAWRVAGSK